MAKRDDFKKLARLRLRTVRILIKESDWGGSAYMMGYVLEFALKAIICKTLKLGTYPDKDKGKLSDLFRTHEFNILLTLSGMTDLFGYNGPYFKSWSNFTKFYEGQWPAMRYDNDPTWDETKTKLTYHYLVGKKTSIITQINRKRKW